jgi:hypothetical protein
MLGLVENAVNSNVPFIPQKPSFKSISSPAIVICPDPPIFSVPHEKDLSSITTII